jgi:hypothetical protein
MKALQLLVLAMAGLASVGEPQAVRAQATAAPSSAPAAVVVPHDGNLAGVPAGIKSLIANFDSTRDAFLAKQELLQAALGTATTTAERAAIREQLQANRTAFLAQLKLFRGQLKDNLAALKLKLNHAEFLRIIDAAQSAAAEGGPDHHRGH